MSKLKVLVADDEPLARERMVRLLKEADCEVLGELVDGASLLEWLEQHPQETVDVLFLDIQMPGINGLEVLAELKNPPLTVFVTAFRDYSVQAFEVAAIDYLLKPVYEDRLAKTLSRVRAQKVRRLTPAEWNAILPPLQRVAIKAGKGKLFIDLKLVTYFELEDDKVWVRAPAERQLTPWTALREVEEAFPESGMIRIQRNILLRPEAVVGCRGVLGGRLKVRLRKGQELMVSRAMAGVVKARLLR